MRKIVSLDDGTDLVVVGSHQGETGIELESRIVDICYLTIMAH